MTSDKLKGLLIGMRSRWVNLLSLFVRQIKKWFKKRERSTSFKMDEHKQRHKTSALVLQPTPDVESNFKSIIDIIFSINHALNQNGLIQEGESTEKLIQELDELIKQSIQADQQLSLLNYRMPVRRLNGDQQDKIYDDESGSFGLLHVLLGSKEDAYHPHRPSVISLEVLTLLLNSTSQYSKIDNSVIQEIVRRTTATLVADNEALRRNRLEVLETMLQHRPQVSSDINAKSRSLGQTALHMSAFAGDVDLVKMLLEICQDINVDQADNSGNTALHYANMIQDLGSEGTEVQKQIVSNKGEIAKLIIDRGCDRDNKNLAGETAENVSGGSQSVSSIIGAPRI